MTPLLLASGSLSRRTLLSRLGLPFEHKSPDIDETPFQNESSHALATRLARQKAHALASHYPGYLIIGSDQVASLDHEIIGKPGTADNARARLSQFSGRRVSFFTALALLDTRDNHCLVHIEPFDVHFRVLSRQEIEGYVALEPALDSAGGFYMEGLGTTLFERLEGSDPSALMGLPLIALCRLLRETGINPLLETSAP